jgi:type II secretory pathway pseudopilin PulG
MHTTKRHMNKNAFTLIELLVSIAILIIGVVGILLVIPVAQRSSREAGLRTKAAMVAEAALEELKMQGYDALTAKSDWTGTTDMYSWNAKITKIIATDFEGTVSFPQEGMVRIDLEITYHERGKERKETFHTFYSEL